MKLFKKFLSTIMSVGLLFSVASLSAFAINPPFEHWDAEWDDEVFRVIASHTPNDLDECCLALDDALRNKPEIKEKIKHSSDERMSYISHISCTNMRVGYRMSYYWLYLPEPGEQGESGRHRPSPLADLFYAHNVDFSGEAGLVMVSIIFENYRYYLNNGKSKECSIEGMAIDHWYNFLGHHKSREELKEYMIRWPEIKAAHHRALRYSAPFNGILLKIGRCLFGCCSPY